MCCQIYTGGVGISDISNVPGSDIIEGSVRTELTTLEYIYDSYASSRRKFGGQEMQEIRSSRPQC